MIANDSRQAPAGSGAPRCAVIGAANLDIGGFPTGRVSMRDSNPGRVRLSAGGVGRNIACNLARMGVETHLAAALGRDAFADIVSEACDRAGVRLDLAFHFADAATSVYLFIADSDGDMQLAVSDMDICARLTPRVLAPRIDVLNAMDAVVVDCNLSAEALEYLAENLCVPILADAVSTAKAPRLLGILPRLRALKPNAIEAEVLTGIPVHGLDSARRAAGRLVDMGVSRAFVTLGERGVCCADRDGTLLIPGRPLNMVNATGAGDAFTAALAWAELSGMDMADAAVAGMAAASIAVESAETVNPGMTRQALLDRIERLRAELTFQ